MSPRSRPRPPAAAAAAFLVLLALLLGACSSSGDAGSSTDAVAGSADGAGAVAEAQDAAAREAEAPAAQEQLVISVGTVSLRADDVGQARFEVQKVVDRAGGKVTEEETRTSDDGEVRTSRLVLRVPSERYDETMDALERVAELESSTTTSEDVTTQVIDNRVRIRVQRASIRRIEALLARAEDIGDIVRIEAQLSRRQAALNSLLRRQAYLLDQTSLSTITVHLQRESEAAAADEEEATGFLAGLDAGWDALTVFVVALLTVAGALLPWAVALLLLGVPLWLLLHSRRRRRPGPPAPVPTEG